MTREVGSSPYSAATAVASSDSGCDRRVNISLGQTCQKRPRTRSQSAMMVAAHLLSVSRACSSTSVLQTSSQWAEEKRCQTMPRSEEHTSELQSLMRISYAVFCLKKKNTPIILIVIAYNQGAYNK